MGRISYVFDDELHQRAKQAAARKGQPLREWLRRAILAAVERDEDDAAEEDRQRRGRRR